MFLKKNAFHRHYVHVCMYLPLNSSFRLLDISSTVTARKVLSKWISARSRSNDRAWNVVALFHFVHHLVSVSGVSLRVSRGKK